MHLRDGGFEFSPSDLSAFLACPHLTTLDLEVQRGDRRKPHAREELARLLAEKGDQHEQRLLSNLRKQGHEVVEIVLPEGPDAFSAAHDGSEAAMRAGADSRR